MKAPAPLVDLIEKDWQRQVVDLAVMCGWRKAYHTFDSRRSHPGFPDLVLDEVGAVLGPTTARSVQASARLERELREELAA